MKARIPLIVQESIWTSILIVPSFYLFYFLWSSFITAFTVGLISKLVSHPIYVEPHLWGNSFFSLPLIGRLSLSSLLFLFSFHLSLHLNDVILTQAKQLDPKFGKRSGIKWLLEGIRSSDPFIKHIALLDLVSLSKFDLSRRTILFKNEGAWNIVLSETISTINNLTINLQNASKNELDGYNSLNWIQKLLRKTNEKDDAIILTKERLFGDTQAVIWSIQSMLILMTSNNN